MTKWLLVSKANSITAIIIVRLLVDTWQIIIRKAQEQAGGRRNENSDICD